MKIVYNVKDGSSVRLDVWLAKEQKTTRSQIQRLIRQKMVFVNDAVPTKTGIMVNPGDVICIEDTQISLPEKKIKKERDNSLFDAIQIIAEAEDYLVINKPAGLVVHPTTESNDIETVRKSTTLSGWLLQNYPLLAGIGEYMNRPGIVHRLDKDTSGLMVIARNQPSFIHLKQQFKDRTVKKHYYALAYGAILANHGLLDFPIGRGNNGLMAARPKITTVTLKNVGSLTPGRAALTEFTVIKRFVNYTLLDVTLHTGRTHQIRVHCFAYNHPLVGDSLYTHKRYTREMKKNNLTQVFLHAYQLEFFDRQGEKKHFESPLPQSLADFLTTLEKKKK